jgi:quinohemoprotein ethanol dehydrogenase
MPLRKSGYGIVLLSLAALLSGPVHAITDAARLSDTSDGKDWGANGRTFGEQHYSPLTEINDKNVDQLGLAWSVDLGNGNAATNPLEVDGTVYLATGFGIVRAIDVASGKQLWLYDAKSPEQAGEALRAGWGIRGLGYWNGKVYMATFDGRLIAVDTKTGKPVWTVQTFDKPSGRYISGAPRLFNGKVIIGHGGADFSPVRGYVTAYDAETGKQLWRFYVVPGDPAKGFENKAMEMAAKTWSGEWWKFGGGGTAWNAMTYDAAADTILIGTGNGDPWNFKIRSQGKGDNLFLCSVVALNATTGEYKWHYQFNPSENWDYNAVFDMALADLKIDGQMRKVMITVPKNGFLYVIDRTNGKLISAKPVTKVTWATGIDIATGRPIENPGARFPGGKPFTLWPGSNGAHNWHAMSFNPKTGLIYVPVFNLPTTLTDKGIEPTWKHAAHVTLDGALNFGVDEEAYKDPAFGKGFLVAWNPATQTEAWRITYPDMWTSGTVSTAGNVVFHGTTDGNLIAYAADSGKKLWSFAAGAPVNGNPITYTVGGKQYVTVTTGIASSSSIMASAAGASPPPAVYGQTPQRVLTFVLGGKAVLPKHDPVKLEPLPDPEFKPDPASAARGASLFTTNCMFCHGVAAVSGGFAPDLRASPVPRTPEAFDAIVHDGGLVSNGMPQFKEFTDQQRQDIRQYIRTEGDKFNKTARTKATQ